MPDGSSSAQREPRRRRAREFTRGRQLDGLALSRLEELFSGRQLLRDRLIEYLHRIQDVYGSLSAAHLRALAEMMQLPMAEIYEVASFYAHFDIVKEGETPPPAVTIRVCSSLSCEMAGAGKLYEALRAHAGPAQIRVLHAPCMGLCDKAPAVAAGHNYFGPANPERALLSARDHEVEIPAPQYEELGSYLDKGGYHLLGACRSGQHTPDGIAAVLNEAGLRGLGGAGFPAGRKWSVVRGYPGPRYLAINAEFKSSTRILKLRVVLVIPAFALECAASGCKCRNRTTSESWRPAVYDRRIIPGRESVKLALTEGTNGELQHTSGGRGGWQRTLCDGGAGGARRAA